MSDKGILMHAVSAIDIPDIVGISPAIVQVRHLIALASRTDVNVVITGETGTGKELVARAIHRSSTLARAPFIAHSCALAPAASFESEFFGHRRGAFPGADQDRVGLLGEADRGVLFLDELECLSLANQAKLLRVLDDGEMRPVGSERSRSISVRFFAATNRSPASMLARGDLRDDLYYRLRGLEIRLPPLRERMEDVPLLADFFLRHHGKTLTPGAAQALARYPWPGNIRQFRSALRYGSAIATGATIDVQNLNLDASAARRLEQLTAVASPSDIPGGGNLSKLSLEEAERQVITQALAAHRGNRSRAAAALGIHRSTLRRRIRQLGLDDPH